MYQEMDGAIKKLKSKFHITNLVDPVKSGTLVYLFCLVAPMTSIGVEGYVGHFKGYRSCRFQSECPTCPGHIRIRLINQELREGCYSYRKRRILLDLNKHPDLMVDLLL